LSLNDGCTATYTGGSGTDALKFSFTLVAGQNISSLTATAVNLNSATIADRAGNAANLSLSGLTAGPEADIAAPLINSIVESPSSAGQNTSGLIATGTNLNGPSVGVGTSNRAAVAFDAPTLGYSPNSYPQGTSVSLTDGKQSAVLALLGSYMSASFAMRSDYNGGTVVTAQADTGDPTLLAGSHHT
jgi:hypothetical protein